MITIKKAKIKKIIKIILISIPFYSKFCNFLLSAKRNRKMPEWVDRMPIPKNIIVKFYLEGIEIKLANADRCSIAKKIYWDFGNRRPIEDEIAILLFQSLSKNADLILDIGANSGLFSLVAAKSNPRAKIIAFDILPEAIHVLFDNLMLNRLTELVDFHLCGIGKPGFSFTVPFGKISSEMPSSLSLDNKISSECNVEVPVRTLDEICLNQNFRNGKLLIKIDTEGTEVDIFLHGKKTLEIAKPDIICEILMFADYKLIDTVLTEFNYKKYLITNKGIVPKNVLIPDPIYKDWLFTQSEFVVSP